MFKMIGLTILGAIGLLLIVGILFINLSPEFGGKITDKEKSEYSKADNFDDGKFVNLIPTSMDMSFSSIVSTLKQYIKGIPNPRPAFKLPIEKIDSLNIERNVEKSRLIWFGHSAFLLEIMDKHILIDPMFGDVPAPHPWLGGNRYSKELPIEIEKLPKIDILLISHDHYDHLDYGSIQKLKSKVKQFFVPLGVGAHFRSWGVSPDQITEFNWWESKEIEDVQLTFTPARHFSGRGISNRNSTLWGGWGIKSKTENLFFSGDSGYGDHFKEIGKKLGPFDFAMMECGQYNDKWAEIHMMPEETAQAGVDVKAKKMMPIHWAAFTLSLHSWTDPVERVIKKAKELNQELIVPKIGESIWLDNISVQGDNWWVK